MKRLGGTFDYPVKRERLTEVERELEDPNVWNDPEKAQNLGKERATLEAIVKSIDDLSAGLEDAEALLELTVEENDEDSLADVQSELDGLEKLASGLEFRRMFSGKMDSCNAYVDIQ